MGICAHVLSKMSRKVDTRLQRVVTLAVWWGGVGWGNGKEKWPFYFMWLCIAGLLKVGLYYFGNKTKRFSSACNKNGDAILSHLALSFSRKLRLSGNWTKHDLILKGTRKSINSIN